MSLPMSQQQYRTHMEFIDKHPEWSKRALEATNRWGRGEATLVVAVAQALIQAHADGIAGVNVETPTPTKKVLRRTR